MTQRIEINCTHFIKLLHYYMFVDKGCLKQLICYFLTHYDKQNELIETVFIETSAKTAPKIVDAAMHSIYTYEYIAIYI